MWTIQLVNFCADSYLEVVFPTSETHHATSHARYSGPACGKWPQAGSCAWNRTKDEIDFQPVVKLFAPDAGCTWLLTEIDPNDTDVAYGLYYLGTGYPKLGSVRLSEIAAVRGRLGRRPERDLWFEADKPLSAYAKEAARLDRINA